MDGRTGGNMSREKSSYLPRDRFDPADPYKKWRSPYQFDSSEIQNLVQDTIAPVYTRTILLSTAQAPTSPLVIPTPGRAFRFVGLTTASQYNFSTNAGIETVVTNATIGVWVNKQGSDSDALIMKNGGGFRGDFLNLFLFWPAQASNSGRIIIYTFDDTPYTTGDSGT